MQQGTEKYCKMRKYRIIGRTVHNLTVGQNRNARQKKTNFKSKSYLVPYSQSK